MACPFFHPIERLDQNAADARGRYPLGDLYRGECRAAGRSPSEGELRTLCNVGYARGRCPFFPPEHAADAARFVITRDTGGTVAVAYAMERDHRPLESGLLEYDVAAGLFRSRHPDAGLLAQARGYVQAYFRRKAALPPAARRASPGVRPATSSGRRR